MTLQIATNWTPTHPPSSPSPSLQHQCQSSTPLDDCWWGSSLIDLCIKKCINVLVYACHIHSLAHAHSQRERAPRTTMWTLLISLPPTHTKIHIWPLMHTVYIFRYTVHTLGYTLLLHTCYIVTQIFMHSSTQTAYNEDFHTFMSVSHTHARPSLRGFDPLLTSLPLAVCWHHANS